MNTSNPVAMPVNHGTLHLQGKAAEPFKGKVGQKVMLPVHGIVESHEIGPDYEAPSEDVPEGETPKPPKDIHKVRIRVQKVGSHSPTLKQVFGK